MVNPISGNIQPDGSGNEIRVVVNAFGDIGIVIGDPASGLQANVFTMATNPDLTAEALVTYGICYGWDGTVFRRIDAPLSLTDSDPDLDNMFLLGTHSLLSARKDANTTIGITATDGTYNPLHVQLADGNQLSFIIGTGADNLANTLNQLLVASYLYGFDGTDWERTRVDQIITGALLTQQIEHYEVHQGDMFLMSDVRTIPAGNVLYYHIRDIGGATAEDMHTAIKIIADAAVTITIFENPTISNDGTALVAHNKNRDVGGAPGTTFFHTPTITVNGTQIYTGLIPSATNPAMSAGGRTKGTNEWLLDSGDAYLIRIAGAVGDGIGIEIEFYEE